MKQVWYFEKSNYMIVVDIMPTYLIKKNNKVFVVDDAIFIRFSDALPDVNCMLTSLDFLLRNCTYIGEL